MIDAEAQLQTTLDEILACPDPRVGFDCEWAATINPLEHSCVTCVAPYRVPTHAPPPALRCSRHENLCPPVTSRSFKSQRRKPCTWSMPFV